ncbi:MAG TPA: hypothetical protein VNN77_10100 [candidate division Zixibacteria bacterium]|nr:hypothetical protein [candidate division Zixibacteria bacterium]
MPYGCLNGQKLSRASLLGLEKALDWWQKSMHTSKHKTYFVVAAYEDDAQEVDLRRELVTQRLADPELLANTVTVVARNEEALAQKISRMRDLLPIETITVFVESRNALSVKAIFKRKFGKTLQIRKYRSDFEFNHRWISTSTPFAWLSRNLLLRFWFEAKKRMGRGLRKKLRFLFRS